MFIVPKYVLSNNCVGLICGYTIINMHTIQHEVVKYKLSYGCDMLEIQIPNYPISASSCWLNAGSKNDPFGKEGLAHFFEHLLCNRTKKYPQRQKRLEEVEKRGFYYNATTTKELQRYFYIHTSDKSKDAFNFLCDGVFDSFFTSDDLNREKNIILNEERNNFLNPSQYIWRLADRGVWSSSILEKDLYGNQNTIMSIQKSDILNFYQSLFIPSNMFFLIINPQKHDTSVITERLHGFKNNKKGEASPFRYHIQPFVFEKRDTDLTYLALTFVTTNAMNLNDAIVLDFIRDYLASGWLSRLIRRLRVENTFAYWVNSETSYYKESGSLRFYMSINPSDFNSVINIFEEEIYFLVTNFIKKIDLQTYIFKYKSDLLRRSLEIDWLLWWYGWYGSVTHSTPLSIVDYINQLDKITPQLIQNIARKYLSKDNFSLAAIGREEPIYKMAMFQ